MDEEKERIFRVTTLIRELGRIGGPGIAEGFIRYGDWLLETMTKEHPEKKRPVLTVVNYG